MSNFNLCFFRLSFQWTVLFEKLPLWTRIQRDVWTDGRAVVSLCDSSEIGFGFTVRNEKTWRGLVGRFGKSAGFATDGGLTAQTPAGIAIKLRKHCERHEQKPDNRLFMNHVSVNIPDLETERNWYEQVLGERVIMARDSVWEPVAGRYVKDAHLFRSPDFYITLRENDTLPNVDHVGWMALETATIDETAEIIKILGWDIVYGPTEIDGSYLFHFQTPDGKIHDFFCPLPTLPKAGEIN